MAAKKKAATGNIEARLAALRADFEALQTDMKGLYGDVSEVASERAALAMRSAEEIADRAVALAEEAATRSQDHRAGIQGRSRRNGRTKMPRNCAPMSAPSPSSRC